MLSGFVGAARMQQLRMPLAGATSNLSMLALQTRAFHKRNSTLLAQAEQTSTVAPPLGESSAAFKPNVLKIVPNETDISVLERQDELIKRRRKDAKEAGAMKKLKPHSPGLRWFRKAVNPHLWKGKPVKFLTMPQKKTGGRNNQGKITVRHRGGGHKRRIRLVDFNRMDSGQQIVERIEYDPCRSAHIALIKNLDSGKLSYILAADGLRQGDHVESFRNGIPQRIMSLMNGSLDSAILSVHTCQRGNCLPIRMIPIGSIVHNIGLQQFEGGKLCRAAGTYGRILDKIEAKKKAIVRLQSGEHRYVHLEACATLGVVSNIDHQNESWGKAGRARWRGIRPTVRGVAMNKVDHPHGGGRGKSKGKKLSQSPWGTLSKGYKTRKGKNQNRMKVKDRPRDKSKK